MRILIFPGNSAFNCGDRANLYATLSLLRECYPNADLVTESYEPERDRHWYPARIVKKGWLLNWQQLKEIYHADIIVWGIGAVVADNSCRTLIPFWMLVIAICKYVFGKTIFGWAHGIVIRTEPGSFFAQFLLSWPDALTVRDQNSLDTVHRVTRGRVHAHLTGDAGILISPASKERAEELLKEHEIPLDRPIIAIIPTFWPLLHCSSDIIPYLLARKLGLRPRRNSQRVALLQSGLTRMINGILESSDATVMLIPHYPALPYEDVSYLSEIRAATHTPARVVVAAGQQYGPYDYFSLWRRFDLLITSSLHAGIVATATGCPCIHFYYEPKGEEFFRTANALHRCLDWIALFDSANDLRIQTLIQAVLQNPSIGRCSPEVVETLKENARENQKLLEVLMQRSGSESRRVSQ